MKEADYYDSPEEVAKCLNCPYDECVECINQPRAERWERDARAVKKYLLDGYGRRQIRYLLKMKQPYLEFIIERIYSKELADENDIHFKNTLYNLWSQGCSIKDIAYETELTTSLTTYYIHQLGLK